MRRSLAPSQRNKTTEISAYSSPVTQKVIQKSVLCKKSPSTPNSLVSPKTATQSYISDSSDIRVFSVVFGKPSKKKHKTWDGDGTLEIDGKNAILKDTNGKIIGQTGNLKKCDLDDGAILYVGSKEVEISTEILSNKIVLNAPEVTTKRKIPNDENSIKMPPLKKERPSISRSMNFGIQKLKSSNIPTGFEPLDLPSPGDSHQWNYNENNLPLTPVTVDGFLCKVLRKHQRDGVYFMYKCVTGIRNVNYKGAILADEMGLGKTLQCISVIWTLLNQGPYGAIPLAKKILIVVPSSLVQNWKNEFTRWIGSVKIKTFVVDKNHRPKQFPTSHCSVLIVSYEMFVKHYEDIESVKFDLVVCDEGHRLKNISIRSTSLLNSISCKSRILLTGTPIQNDLQEFYALVNFVNPGILGSPSEFARNFEKQILASKEPNSQNEVVDAGNAKAAELNRLTSDFILRRTQELIGKYLPQKTDYVVFCEPTTLQKSLYMTIVEYWNDRKGDFVDVDGLNHLTLISAMKKIVNHPFLLKNASDEEDTQLLKLFGELNFQFKIEDSGKIMVVDSIVKSICVSVEKIVLVSNYTQTLDLFERICNRYECQFLRLDGSTPTANRNNIVTQFNSSTSPIRVLLLSSKAGGVGLNLIGASRLILYDSDWNPATDLQAMARIWREGQKKTVHIYRLLTSGTIDEKIFQRQLKKTSLNENIVETSKTNFKLSKEELRDLFTYSGRDICLTHDSLKCPCPGDGTIAERLEDSDRDDQDCLFELDDAKVASNLKMNQLLQWEHYQIPLSQLLVSDMMISDALRCINYVFRNKTTSCSVSV